MVGPARDQQGRVGAWLLHALHIVELGTQVLEEVCRRVQQYGLGCRGHRDAPLYRVRGLLRRGVERSSPGQVGSLGAARGIGDPGWQASIGC